MIGLVQYTVTGDNVYLNGRETGLWPDDIHPTEIIREQLVVFKHDFEYSHGRPSTLQPVYYKCKCCQLLVELFDGHLWFYESYFVRKEVSRRHHMPNCAEVKMRKVLT
jgi:hypothetical protein